MAFADQLRGWREQAGLTQAELAKRLRVTQQTVSDWEAGEARPRMDRMTELAEAFGVPADQIVAAILTPLPAGQAHSRFEHSLSALAGAEKLTAERRAQLIGYLERLLEEQEAESTK